MTVLSKVCFCVLNAAYIDPAIVSLSSYFKYNDLPVIVFYEKGTDISRLKAALAENQALKAQLFNTNQVNAQTNVLLAAINNISKTGS